MGEGGKGGEGRGGTEQNNMSTANLVFEMFRKHCLHLCVQSQVCGPQAKLCQPSQMSFSLRCHFPGKIFSIIFIFKEKILFIFRCHFSVMIFFKLFPPISFAYSKVKPSKLRNFLIFFPFCLLSTCQVWYFQSLSLWHAISHESCLRVFLIHSQSFHFFHLKGQCHKIFCFNDTGSKLPPVSTTLGVNLLPVSMTLVAHNGNNIRLLTL